MKTQSLERPIVIVGAGMTGLLAALFIKKKEPRADVILVECSDRVGGNYRGMDLPGFGYCDMAMRLIYETGIPEFDSILHGLLPEDEWHILPDNVKDVVGAYWQGELQTHSPYLDLRRLGEPVRQRCEREVLESVRKDSGSEPAENASRYLQARFGPTAGGYVEKVLEKLYGVPSSLLHRTATVQPAMDRVILYGEEQMLPIMKDQKMRSVIAWPDQLTLPVKRVPAQSGLYPRRFGINRVIDAAFQHLQQQGVRFVFNRKVSSLDLDCDMIAAARLDNGDVIDHPALLISANGLHGSLGMLINGTEPLPNIAPPRVWLVFLRTQERPGMDGLYHFWCFDEAYRTFRVTSYANYCPAARNEQGYPLCVELWSEDQDASHAIARALRELQGMNICGEDGITAQAAMRAANMHSLCSLESVDKLRAMREEVRRRSPQNMVTVGPFIEDGLMLLYEVSRRMCAMISARL
jgi:protoporphyrinogen oxidase